MNYLSVFEEYGTSVGVVGGPGCFGPIGVVLKLNPNGVAYFGHICQFG